MATLKSNGIRIAFETTGDPKAAPLLLIAGLGRQLVSWPEGLVDGLAELGFYVIRFDNRDSGLSTGFEHAGTPSLALASFKSALRWPVRAPYRLGDMADDALGVLSALGVARAHVAGVSIGGMIGQLLAAKHPQRVLSLASIMSSSGRRGLPGPTAQARDALMARLPAAHDLEGVARHLAQLWRAIGSPAYPTPERQLLAAARCEAKRSLCAAGAAGQGAGSLARQMAAIAASGSRAAVLRSIRTPTLVIHGAADPLLPLACGIDTARLVPGARLEVIEGMGHDLPSQLIERLLALIDAHAHGKMAPDPTSRLFVKQ